MGRATTKELCPYKIYKDSLISIENYSKNDTHSSIPFRMIVKVGGARIVVEGDLSGHVESRAEHLYLNFGNYIECQNVTLFAITILFDFKILKYVISIFFSLKILLLKTF